jgi:ABC-2 type transport system ATP-binding protein
MDAPAIGIRGLTKTFGRGQHAVRALCDVSLDVRAGSITGLLGPNGAGQSTLILAALGLVRPDSGRSELFGEPASTPSARIGVGFLPEEVSYEAGFTIGEVLRLHARLADAAGGRRCLERFDLRLPLGRRISRCSHGTTRRLALACALVGAPRLLVLDEPTSGLDVASREFLLGELVRFREGGGTVFVSSHVLAEMESVCDGLVILERGRLAYNGDLLEPKDVSRICITVTGIPRERLEPVLDCGWAIREERGRLFVESPAGCSLLAGMPETIERIGGTVVDIRRGHPLSEVYRRQVGT